MVWRLRTAVKAGLLQKRTRAEKRTGWLSAQSTPMTDCTGADTDIASMISARAVSACALLYARNGVYVCMRVYMYVATVSSFCF